MFLMVIKIALVKFFCITLVSLELMRFSLSPFISKNC